MRNAGLEWAAESVARIFPYAAVVDVCQSVANRREGFSSPDYSKQAELLREIYGNPFRPITLLTE
jgi:hypothetical protein